MFRLLVTISQPLCLRLKIMALNLVAEYLSMASKEVIDLCFKRCAFTKLCLVTFVVVTGVVLVFFIFLFFRFLDNECKIREFVSKNKIIFENKFFCFGKQVYIAYK